MIFYEYTESHGLAIPILVAASVIVASFLAMCFLHKKRLKSDNPDETNANNLQQQQQENDGSPETPSSSSLGDQEAGDEFEVFLSFSGPNIEKTFTDYLYHSLIDAGVNVFRDHEEHRAGAKEKGEISPKLTTLIEQSKIGIPIFSVDFASSEWCLMEVAEMVKSMKQSRHLTIMPVFFDATPDEVQHQTGSYVGPFFQHERKFGQEKVQQWRDALKEVVKLKGLELAKVANGHQGEFTKLIVARVIRELKKLYLEMGDVLVGIDDRAEELMEKLEVGIADVRFVGILGMGGIGKTTLAKFVYNQIVDMFESSSFLKDIRQTSKNPGGLQYLQSKLVSDILGCEPENYATVEAGISVLKSRLVYKRALILLDDVDSIDQIESLAADIGWFGRGSRIIVTTREKKVLFQVQDPYEVPFLDTDQALELFNRHAFRSKLPRHDFMKEASEIVGIIGGLPLSLEVIGSFLSIFVGRKDIWHDTIEKLKGKTDRDIQDKLGISYEALDHEQKEIFLDIACLFNGMDVRLVIPMWKDAEFFPEVGIELLLLKSLIKIGEDNIIWMHDQLRDIGKTIVEQEDREPGRRSRLWHGDDGADVLLGQQGTSKVEAISLEGYHFMEDEDHLDNEMFKNLSRLRILRLAYARLDGNFQNLFHQLKWLSWNTKHILQPENLTLANIVVLDISGSMTVDEGIGQRYMQIGSTLKVFNLSYCRITTAPDFSAFPGLEILILEGTDLVCIDPSIGLLKKLILLNLRRCRKLKELPEQLGSMESLVELVLNETGIKEVPNLSGMKKLEILSAEQCDYLRDLPASIGSLVNLKRLSLSFSRNIEGIPDSIGQLSSLVELNLSNTRIRRLPDFVGDIHDLELLNIEGTYVTCLPTSLRRLIKLKVLDANWDTWEITEERYISEEILSLSSLRILKFNGIKSLPVSMSGLSCLQTFWIINCQKLETVPELPPSLSSLKVSEASSKLTLINLINLVNLKELTLSGDFELKKECLSTLRKLEKITLERVYLNALPEEIGGFLRLKQLRISNSGLLECLPTLPSSLSDLTLENCSSLERLPDLSNLKKLSKLHIDSCPNIREIRGLENIVSLKMLWISGSPLTELDGVMELQFLTTLSLVLPNLERLPDLSKWKNLKELSLCCRSLKQLPGFPTTLESLSLKGCERITDIKAATKLELLKELDISGCKALSKLPDLSELKRLRRITMVDCNHIEEVPTRAYVWRGLSSPMRISLF